MQVLELHTLLLKWRPNSCSQIIHHSPETSHLAQSSGVSQHLIHKDILFHHQVRQKISKRQVVVEWFWWILSIQRVQMLILIILTIASLGNAQDFGDLTEARLVVQVLQQLEHFVQVDIMDQCND